MTTPQMDWLDDQRRKRAVSSDEQTFTKCCQGCDPSCDGPAACADRAWTEIERLRAAGDALAATWPEEDRCGCDNKDCRAVVKAFDAWEEARRV